MKGMPRRLSRVEGQCFRVKYWVSAAGKFPVVSEDDMLRKTINESSEPVLGRLGIEEHAQRGHFV